MAWILQLETATTMCSVAVSFQGVTTSLKEVNNGYSHAEAIEGLIDETLAEANITLNDLSAVAVSKGPGSYTGLRIAVSLAKGLCFGLQIPLISIDSLVSMSYLPATKNLPHLLLPMLDARRMEVYTCEIKQHQAQKEIEAKVIDATSFSHLTEPVVYFGPGAEKCAATFAEKENFTFLPNIWPSADGMSHLSFEKLKNNEIENVAYFEPYYLKDFVAGKPKKLL